MPCVLPEPDEVRRESGGEVPLWKCPNCGALKTIEEYGWRKRDDIYPDQDVWHKQSWCKDCRAGSS